MRQKLEKTGSAFWDGFEKRAEEEKKKSVGVPAAVGAAGAGTAAVGGGITLSENKTLKRIDTAKSHLHPPMPEIVYAIPGLKAQDGLNAHRDLSRIRGEVKTYGRVGKGLLAAGGLAALGGGGLAAYRDLKNKKAEGGND